MNQLLELREEVAQAIVRDEVNGATWFLPGSQWRADSPSEQEFYEKADA